MQTKPETLEELIADVRGRRVAQAKPVAKANWREAVGLLKNCEDSNEAFRIGAEWREQMNREGR